MSTFTRVWDSTVLNPVSVFGPFEQTRRSRRRAQPLMEDAAVSLLGYVPPEARSGTFLLLFHTYAEADAACRWFLVESLYWWTGAVSEPATYTYARGYLQLTTAATLDEFAIRFLVPDAELPIKHRPTGVWEVQVPYREVPE